MENLRTDRLSVFAAFLAVVFGLVSFIPQEVWLAIAILLGLGAILLAVRSMTFRKVKDTKDNVAFGAIIATLAVMIAVGIFTRGTFVATMMWIFITPMVTSILLVIYNSPTAKDKKPVAEVKKPVEESAAVEVPNATPGIGATREE